SALSRIVALTPPPSAPAKLGDTPRPSGAPEAAAAPSSRRPKVLAPVGAPADLSRAFELLREDRIAEAPGALPPGGDGDPEAQLLRAVLLSSSGDVAGAERACHAVLALDPLHAGACYLLALCREHEGDGAGAVEHDRAAVYLEPRFGMPHLHLGLLA